MYTVMHATVTLPKNKAVTCKLTRARGHYPCADSIGSRTGKSKFDSRTKQRFAAHELIPSALFLQGVFKKRPTP